MNVLGRFNKCSNWNDAGIAKQMDDPRIQNLSRKEQKTSPLYQKLDSDDPARTPARRAMLKKMGQAQRCMLVDNVPSLAFRDQKLAASIGATASELNKEPVSELACDIVFDALTQSKSGFVSFVRADEARMSYQSADGSFDAATFEADLDAARLNVIKATAVFPGSIIFVQLIIAVQLSADPSNVQAGLDMVAQGQANLQAGWAESGWATVPFPLLLLILLLRAPSAKIGKPLGGGRPPTG